MNAVSIDIKDMLVAESALALTFKKDLFIGMEPTRPDNTVTIFDTPSFPPDIYMDPEERYYNSACQIRVRHKDYQEGMALARNIMELLHARANEVWDGTTYTVIMATGEPAWLDMDANNRSRFIININLQRR